jgi:alpha-ketoglutarate-dependent taurine dioxygenase
VKPAGAVIAQLSDGIGAEITGLDCGAPLDAAARALVARALEAHRVIVIRDQSLDDEHLIALARTFGNVEEHYVTNADGTAMTAVHEVSNLDELGKPNEKPFQNSNFHWHSDKSYRALPTFVTMLTPSELPPDRGETQFADMTGAFAALPEARQRAIAPLRAVHSLEHMRRLLEERPLTEQERRDSPPVTHPLVRTHPVTGARSLYLGIYVSHVAAMPTAESRALLDTLTEHATQPRFVFTHTWRPGDVVAWDNRWLMHRALPNFEMSRYRRVMRRVVVKGTAPQ